MNRKIAILLIAAFSIGIAFSACQSKNQCKQFKRKQNKKRRRSEVIKPIIKDFQYEDYAVQTA